jgi:hypothetical protein
MILRMVLESSATSTLVMFFSSLKKIVEGTILRCVPMIFFNRKTGDHEVGSAHIPFLSSNRSKFPTRQVKTGKTAGKYKS